MPSVSVRIDEEVKEKMSGVKINWSEYIREAIRRRGELEERKRMAESVVEGLREKRAAAPKGFINRTVREMREAR